MTHWKCWWASSPCWEGLSLQHEGPKLVVEFCLRVLGVKGLSRRPSLLGMDVYGYLLAREGRLEDVENLGCRLFNISDQHAEPWVVSGYIFTFCFLFLDCLRQ